MPCRGAARLELSASDLADLPSGLNVVKLVAQSPFGSSASLDIPFTLQAAGSSPMLTVEGGLVREARKANGLQLRTSLQAQSVCAASSEASSKGIYIVYVINPHAIGMLYLHEMHVKLVLRC